MAAKKCRDCTAKLEATHELVGVCFFCLRSRTEVIDWEKEARYYRQLAVERGQHLERLIGEDNGKEEF